MQQEQNYWVMMGHVKFVGVYEAACMRGVVKAVKYSNCDCKESTKDD